MKIIKQLTTILAVLICTNFVFSQNLVLDTSFAPVINGGVKYVKVLDNGKILISGDFTTVNGQANFKLALLNSDGSVDPSFNTNWLPGPFNQGVGLSAVNALPDGKVLIAGQIPYNGSSGALRIFRLNADGSFDKTLTAIPTSSDATFSQNIKKVEQLPNGKMLVCGKLAISGSSNPSYLTRYNYDGTLDTPFLGQFNNECLDTELQPDGKYLVSGYFSEANGIPQSGLTRFNSDDTIDSGFTAATLPNYSQTYYLTIKLMNDGTIVGFQGNTTNTSRFVSRLNANGSLIATYPTDIDLGLPAGDAELLPNGKMLVSAKYRPVFGQTGSLERFNRDGSHDPSVRMYGTGSGSSEYPISMEVDADEKIILGGNFGGIVVGENLNSQPYLARFISVEIPVKRKFDFDGDGKDDLTVFRPSDRVWYINQSTNGFFAMQFGLSTDKPVAYDYDDDGRADIAVYRNGVWYWMRSSDNVFSFGSTGRDGDIPQPYSRKNVGTPHLLVFRPSQAKFYIQAPFSPERQADSRTLPMTSNDIPVVADYDGDGTDDLAVFNNGNWFHLNSNNLQVKHYQFGQAGDKPVIGDFDADGRTDYAVFRPSNGVWYIQQTAEGFRAVQWGISTDLPVPGDYNGDGRTDIAVYRDGIWYILYDNNTVDYGFFGLAGDIPAQLAQ